VQIDSLYLLRANCDMKNATLESSSKERFKQAFNEIYVDHANIVFSRENPDKNI